MSVHTTRFFRSTSEPGLYRAVCSCSWSIEGDLEHVQARAATHDLDADAQLVREPPLRREGFVSGLPDKNR